MKKWISRLITLIECYWIRFKIDTWPEIARYIVLHIWIDPPPAPNNGICPMCRGIYRVAAYHDGEGWCFFWVCGDECQLENETEDIFIDNWFPFLNGWANGKELMAHGVDIL